MQAQGLASLVSTFIPKICNTLVSSQSQALIPLVLKWSPAALVLESILQWIMHRLPRRLSAINFSSPAISKWKAVDVGTLHGPCVTAELLDTMLCYVIQYCRKRRRQSSKHMKTLTRHLKRDHAASQSQLQPLNIQQIIVTMRTLIALGMQIISRWFAYLWNDFVWKFDVNQLNCFHSFLVALDTWWHV